MTLAAIAEASGARLDGADPETLCTAVSVDSRTIEPGALFVAVRGERDGHDFVDAALGAGACAALVEEDRPFAGPVLRCDDALAALGRLASAARAASDATVVAVTGSSGKTMTKDLIALACSTMRPTHASPGSFNNEIGVPLTILGAPAGAEVLVAEVGARGEGHIASLMPMVRPDVSVVLNVGVAHIGMFGSREAIARAKGELVEALSPSGVAVLNADDAAVAAMRERTAGRVVTFGTSPDADVRAEEVRIGEDACARFRVVAGGSAPAPGEAAVTLSMPGEHMVSNALAAIAAAGAAGVSVADAARGVGGRVPSRWRMEVAEAPGGWTVVNDAYNANPHSTAAALKTLAALGRGRRIWAVLGVMAELGDTAAEEHDRIGRLAVRLGVSRLVVVGEEARATFEGARHEGIPPHELFWAPDAAEALRIVREAVEAGDVVLVKASRAAGLESVAEGLVSAG